MISEEGYWFPKYTSLVGGLPGIEYLSDIVDAAGWTEVHAHVVLEATMSSTSVACNFQKSADKLEWTEILPATGVVTGTITTTSETDPERPYWRLKLKVSGVDKTVTLWALRLVRSQS